MRKRDVSFTPLCYLLTYLLGSRTHTTDQHHVPIDPRAAELMPIHAARLALTRSVTQKAVDPSMGLAQPRVRLTPPKQESDLLAPWTRAKRSEAGWRRTRQCGCR